MAANFFSAVLGAVIFASTAVGVTASAAEVENISDTESTVVEEITENEGIAATSDNVTSTENPDNLSDDEMEKYHEIMSDLANAENADTTADYENDPYYDTDGNATIVKSEQIIYNTEEMQFIAVTTKDGHVFYVLINYSAENDEDQVFFLNKVDDYDLYALLYAGEESDDEKENITPEQALKAAQAANGRVQVDSAAAVTETEESTNETAESEQVTAQSNNMNPNSIYLVVGVIALIGVGAGGYFVMKKKGSKSEVKETVDDEDEDDITFPYDEDY